MPKEPIESASEVAKVRPIDRWHAYREYLESLDAHERPANLPLRNDETHSHTKAIVNPLATDSSNFFSKVWDFISDPLAVSPDAPIKPGGIPKLEPSLIYREDEELHRKLQDEFYTMLLEIYQPSESIRGNEQAILKAIILHLNRLKELFEEYANNIKVHYVFNLEKDKQTRQEKTNFDEEKAKAEKNSKMWGRISNGLFWTATTITVASIASVILANYGITPHAFTTGVQKLSQAAQALGGLGSGISAFLKANQDKIVAECQEMSSVLREQHNLYSFHTTRYIENLNKTHKCFLDCVTTQRLIADKWEKTTRSILLASRR